MLAKDEASGRSRNAAVVGNSASSENVKVGNSSKPNVMQQMAQQLSQAFGKRSTTAAAANDKSIGSNLFSIADPSMRFSTDRASISDLPHSLDHNDDF